MAKKSPITSRRTRLEGAEATVAALRRIWENLPPPLRTVAWTITSVVVAAVLRGADLVGIDPFSGTVDLLLGS